MAEFFLIVASYFLGAVPFGVIIVSLRGGMDLRSIGSGNIGATNVTRALGRKAGVGTLLLDALKGAVPVFFALWLDFGTLATDLVALAAVLGHCYSPYLRFRGGKGVAVGLGVCLVLVPLPALLAAASWVLFWRMWRIVAAASLLAALVLTISTAVVPPARPHIYLVLLLVLIIYVRHRDNIDRMRKHKELGFGPTSTSAPDKPESQPQTPPSDDQQT